MCKCIEYMAENGYVQPNLLNPGQYFIYAMKDGKAKKGAPALELQVCPSCGEKLVTEKAEEVAGK